MKQTILKLLITFAVFVAVMMLDRMVFLAIYADGCPLVALLEALWHGVAMDCSVAGYLTVIPAVLAVVSPWIREKIAWRIEAVYYYVVGYLLAIIFLADIELYAHWDFRLDMTPLFYFATSPSAAMASMTSRQILIGVLSVVVIGRWIALLLKKTAGRIVVPRAGGISASIAATVVLILLIVPVRGGLTVSTMNLSRAYFSSDMRLNHIAVNPAFSLMYSAGHQGGFAGQFRSFADDNAARAMLPAAQPSIHADSLSLTDQRPDICLIILESFSSHLMPSLGGQPIALALDSIARSGAVWTSFYANSFRTDRALPAVLGGFPSQPTTSVMKYAAKAERLPGIVGELKRQAGYETTYYYGGDANFTNMLAYLRGAGFDRVVSDKDFPLSARLGKWGAHDDVLVQRVLSDWKPAASPQFTVVQTSSSHEPFEVPATFPRFAGNSRANAFAFADSCLRVLVDGLQSKPLTRPLLIVIVPDHYGAWPLRDSLPDFASRHAVPLVLTGDALKESGVRFNTVGSQNDIAATLLGLLGLDSSAFPFSHNLLDPDAPHFAWITEPELVGVITADGMGAVNISTMRSEHGSVPQLAEASKAHLQILYSALGN